MALASAMQQRTSGGPSSNVRLIHPGMPLLTSEDFLGPANNRPFVVGLGRRLAPPPVKVVLDAMLETELSAGLEAVALQVWFPRLATGILASVEIDTIPP